jgi:nucleoside-diphosphate-sugar epimerase
MEIAMKVFVTGSAGKIGSLVTGLLEESGHTVFGFDLKNGQDFRDYAALVSAMADCECVVHLGGIPHPYRNGQLDPFIQHNVLGTYNVVRAAVENGIERMVYSSSTAFYGCNMRGEWTQDYWPVDEQHPPLTVPGDRFAGELDAYNVSKVMAEQVLGWYATNSKIQVIVLRLGPANVKADQYAGVEDFTTITDWRRGSLFANCHPEYAADALFRAAIMSVPFVNFQVFNIVDMYPPDGLDLDWLASEVGVTDYPLDRSPFYTDKASLLLGWEPCKDR